MNDKELIKKLIDLGYIINNISFSSSGSADIDFLFSGKGIPKYGEYYSFYTNDEEAINFALDIFNSY